MVSSRAAPALLATLVVLASTGAAAQIEPPRPVEELAPDSPMQRPSRTRREPPPPPAEAPAAEEEASGAETQEPAPPPPPPQPPRPAPEASAPLDPGPGACTRPGRSGPARLHP